MAKTISKPRLDQILPPLRVSQIDCDVVARKAKAAGFTVSEYRRRAYHDCQITVRTTALNIEAVKNLMAIGNNLNQLTRKAHIHDEYNAQELQRILSVVEEQVMRLMEEEG